MNNRRTGEGEVAGLDRHALANDQVGPMRLADRGARGVPSFVVPRGYGGNGRLADVEGRNITYVPSSAFYFLG